MQKTVQNLAEKNLIIFAVLVVLYFIYGCFGYMWLLIVSIDGFHTLFGLPVATTLQ